MSRDAFDRLRDADPLRDTALPDADSPQARAMRDTIMAGRATDLDGARRRRRLAVAAAAVAAAAAAAALAVSTSRVSDPTSIGCFDAPATDANTFVLQATGGSPVAQCRELWEQGQVDPAVATPDQVPDLVACVLETSGHVGVFPAASCEDVRTTGSTDVEGPLPDQPDGSTTSPREDASPTDEATAGLDAPDYHTDDRVVVEALEEIRLTLIDTCLSIDQATTFVEATLAEHGLEGWTVGPVIDGPYDPHCAAFFPEAAERAVWLVPEEPTDELSPPAS